MLAAGTQLGPYKILAPLGAGGMGEVYRARDTRPQMARDVAIKVLPSHRTATPEARARFEREARAISKLNHPHICTLFDVGKQDGIDYLVMELVEGDTLATRLAKGALPLADVLAIGRQVAQALDVAHRAGVVHRDLKPANVMLVKTGAKLMDFGLAHAVAPATGSLTQAPTASRPITAEGTIVGTFQYMAPEQLEGREADARTDLWALGCVLYEMATGQRAFAGESQASLIAAIMTGEPRAMLELQPVTPASLERVVLRCLAKDPDDRFQSAADLAFALEGVGGSGKVESLSGPGGAAARKRPSPALLVLAGLCAVAAVVSLGLLAAKQREIEGRAAAVTYTRITFRRGAVSAARFAPDGKAVYYTATWDGEPLDLFETEPGSVTSRSLGIPQSHLLSISKAGMVALSLESDQFIFLGTKRVAALAEVPSAGGAPHRLLEDVRAADWSPDRNVLVVARQVGGRDELQMPAGHTIYRSAGWISHVRIAPSGGRIAFQDHTSPPNIRGNVVIVDTRGKVLARTPEWRNLLGLAWSADGGEIWYGAAGQITSSATTYGGASDLMAMSTDGRERVIQRFPGDIALHDIARDGRVLLARSQVQVGIRGRRSPADAEIEMDWQDFSVAGDISSDGRTLLFTEMGTGGGTFYSTYLRDTEGSPPVRIGEGSAMSLSPDGKRVLTIQIAAPQRLVILPVGVGDSTSLPRGRIDKYAVARWLPDGKGVVFFGAEAGASWRTYMQDADGGLPRPITPEGVDATCVSPDGRFAAGTVEQRLTIFPTVGQSPRVIAELLPGEQVVCWSDDGQSLFVGREGSSLVMHRIDLSTGKRTVWKTFSVPDPAGVWVRGPVLAQRSQGYAYGYIRWLDDLYVVEGLK